MTCADVLDLVDAIAGGDLEPSEGVTRHLATCPKCADALEAARELDQALRARPVPQPGARFTELTLARVDQARWQNERLVDIGFNLALLALAAGLVGAVWLVVDRAGLIGMSGDAVQFMGSGLVALSRRAAPVVPHYAAATALVGGALGAWWWAESTSSM